MQDIFTDKELNYLQKNNIFQTIMHNYTNRESDNFKMPDYILGPSNIIKLVKNETIIYLFGESHVGYQTDKFSCGKGTTMRMPLFLKNLFEKTYVHIDFYLEDKIKLSKKPLDEENKLSNIFKTEDWFKYIGEIYDEKSIKNTRDNIHKMLINDDRDPETNHVGVFSNLMMNNGEYDIQEIRNLFRSCLTRKNRNCEFNMIRAHSCDTRVTDFTQPFFLFFSGPDNLMYTRQMLNLLPELLNDIKSGNNEVVNRVKKQIDMIKDKECVDALMVHYNYLVHMWYDLITAPLFSEEIDERFERQQKYLKYGGESDYAGYIDDEVLNIFKNCKKEYDVFMLKNKQRQERLKKLEMSYNEYKFQLLEPISLFNIMSNMIVVYDTVNTNRREFEFEEERFIEKMSKQLLLLNSFYGSYLFEIYTTARMLRQFKQKDEKEKTWSETPKYCIFYGGSNHIQTISDILTSAGFESTEFETRNNKYIPENIWTSNDPKCLDVRHIKYYYQFFE